MCASKYATVKLYIDGYQSDRDDHIAQALAFLAGAVDGGGKVIKVALDTVDCIPLLSVREEATAHLLLRHVLTHRPTVDDLANLFLALIDRSAISHADIEIVEALSDLVNLRFDQKLARSETESGEV